MGVVGRNLIVMCLGLCAEWSWYRYVKKEVPERIQQRGTMRIRLSVILALWAIVILMIDIAYAGDHLIPEQGIFSGQGISDPYHVVVRQTLMKGANHEIQMFSLQSFESEQVVYMEKTREGLFRVVSNKVWGESIWAKMTDQIKNDAPKTGGYSMGPESQMKALSKLSFRVNEKRVEIDPKTAGRLSELWERALSDVKYDDSSMAVFDGTTYYFANFRKGVGSKGGVVTSPNEGTKMSDLVNVGIKLSEYAIESQEKRRKNRLEELKELTDKALKRYSSR